MPVTKQAKKKMRQDIKKEAHNKKNRTNLKNLVKNMRRNPSPQALSSVSSALDKAVKTHLVHANAASRLKSRLNKHLVQAK